jgi:GDPmannose 4,6-dehydratase
MLNQEQYSLSSEAEYEGDSSILDEENLPKSIKEYVLSSNETHSVREFVEIAFKRAGIDFYWQKGVSPEEEVLIHETSGKVLLKINPKFYRPAEVDLLLGDSSLARKDLNWEPQISFQKLVERMVDNDVNLAQRKT